MEQGKISNDQLIEFWLRFFDPFLSGTVHEMEYMSALEELVRGSSFKEANKTTKMFANMFKNLLHEANCLGSCKEIITEKMKTALEEEKLDVSILLSALGR